MTYGEFLQLVRQMRTAQKLYYKTRNTLALTRAKELEAEVDEAVRGGGQQSLFPDPEETVVDARGATS